MLNMVSSWASAKFNRDSPQPKKKKYRPLVKVIMKKDPLKRVHMPTKCTTFKKFSRFTRTDTIYK